VYFCNRLALFDNIFNQQYSPSPHLTSTQSTETLLYPTPRPLLSTSTKNYCTWRKQFLLSSTISWHFVVYVYWLTFLFS